MKMEQKSAAEVVATARDAFNKGFTKNVTHRMKYLKSFKKFLDENEDSIVQAMHEDLRKHREEVRFEISIAVNHLKYLMANLKEWVEPKKPPKRWTDLLDGVYIYKDPLGVVLVMGAWNMPVLTLIPVTGLPRQLPQEKNFIQFFRRHRCRKLRRDQTIPQLSSFCKHVSQCVANVLGFDVLSSFPDWRHPPNHYLTGAKIRLHLLHRIFIRRQNCPPCC
jgi:hypothetical protein